MVEEFNSQIDISIFNDEAFTDLVKRMQISGTIAQEYQKTMEFLDSADNRKFYEDVPKAAIKEALLNLLVHRDYSRPYPSQICAYRGGIEFLSYGGLVKGITVDDILNGISACRNSEIYEELQRKKICGTPGQGLRAIYSSYSGSDRKPEIHAAGNSFKIYLPPVNKSRLATSDISPVVEPGPRIYGHQSREEQILETCRGKGYIRRSDVQTLFGISQPMAGIVLRKMVESGMLKKEGNGRSTIYTAI